MVEWKNMMIEWCRNGVNLSLPYHKSIENKGVLKHMKLGIGDETTDSIFQCISLNADIA